MVALFTYGFSNLAVFPAERMTMLWQLNLISLGFWFGERALGKLGLGKLFAPRAKPVEQADAAR